jgi:hypothetical protein
MSVELSPEEKYRAARRAEVQIESERRGTARLVLGWVLLVGAIGVAIFVPSDRRAGGWSLTWILGVTAAIALGLIVSGYVARQRVSEQVRPKEE